MRGKVALAAVAAFLVSGPALGQELEKLNVFGTEMAVKTDGSRTGGSAAAVEATVKPGSGPPKHVHSREDEIFYIIEGRFRLWRGEETLDVGEGAVAFLPRNVPHTYQNIGNTPGRLLVVITPAGLEGFFREASQRGLAPERDMTDIAALAGRYGLTFVGPPPQASK
ncbi:MAG TPA: cupin domain-containing protein [Microvirga sp.]|jgi:quercetin dioxygenase-like cupin family protein|nr:cupin domain-containing protein [Microvirga sp.]